MNNKATALFTRLKVLALTCAGVLSGCSSTSMQEIFPDIYETGNLPEQVDLLVDVMVISDIEGSDAGVDTEKNSLAATNAREYLIEQLANVGVPINPVRSGYGLTYVPEAETAFFVVAPGTLDPQSPYPGPEAMSENDPWIEDDARNFLKTLQTTARTRRNDPDSVEAQEQLAALGSMPHPNAFNALESRYLLMANVMVLDLYEPKEFAIVAAGQYVLPIAMMVATGSWFGVGFSGVASFTYAELTLFDRSDNQIEWSRGWRNDNDDLDSLYAALREAADSFPSRNDPATRRLLTRCDQMTDLALKMACEIEARNSSDQPDSGEQQE